MGLTTTHNCYSGSYSNFNQFRYELGYEIGINLESNYIGFGSNTAILRSQEIDHDLMPLLSCSDCDAKLTIAECKSIAIGLELVLLNLKNTDPEFLEQINKFKKGCILAISRNEEVEFK